MNSYFEAKQKHAYMCYKAHKPRLKVYAVVDCGDGKYAVLKKMKGKCKYALSGGTIEENETIKEAIYREILEELNMESEFVRIIGKIYDKSTWRYKGKEFEVDDDMTIVEVKCIKVLDNIQHGIDGEFATQDIVAYVSKEEMLLNVDEFTTYGLKFE